jgi:hypothetical protein
MVCKGGKRSWSNFWRIKSHKSIIVQQTIYGNCSTSRVREQNVYVEMATPIHQFEVAVVISDRPGPLQYSTRCAIIKHVRVIF